MPDFSYEAAAGCEAICGVDEVGRGPWAGPVLAAAVVFDRPRLPASLAARIDDSKKLTRANREAVAAELPAYARIGIGIADVAEIQQLNIYWASLQAMLRAVQALGACPELALVDGNAKPPLTCPVRCIIGGDALSLSIAAASIIAKVTRDGMMRVLAHEYPGYGFEQHKGYGTAGHRAALKALGPTPHHRMGFPSVQAVLAQLSLAFPALEVSPTGHT